MTIAGSVRKALQVSQVHKLGLVYLLSLVPVCNYWRLFEQYFRLLVNLAKSLTRLQQANIPNSP
ncbi:MAG: hypothetical protein AAFX80_04545, partial [Cyanobacteria bacterium J06639_18]